MIRSYNEIVAMAVKAARGAGIPLGHAEDFGPALAYVVSQDPANARNAVACLEAGPAPLECAVDTGEMTITCISAIMAAPVAIDALVAGVHRVVVKGCTTPDLLAAYCALAGGCAAQMGDVITLTPAKVPAETITAGPVDVDAEIWKALNAFAKKTYVPATEASRLSGAGAGLTDND